jgi:hypothetical protein
MHLSLKGSLKSSLIFTYVKTDQALDLGNLEPFTIPDLSDNANTATLYSGIYVSTNGTTDKAIGAGATALGSGNYYLTGKIKPAGTTAKTTMNGSTASNLTGLTAGVWQDFQTATASAITPSSIHLGWDGTAFNATVDNWSDVKLHDASDDSVVAHWKLYDSADASLGDYPALDCVGGYHGAHVGCAGGASEASILQTAGEDFNKLIRFDGVAVDITTGGLLPATGDFTLTIEFFTLTTSFSLYGSLGAGAGRHILQILADGKAFVFIDGFSALTTANAINLGEVNTYVLSRSGTSWSLTLNGGTAVTTTGSATLDIAGSNIGDPYSGSNFKGLITSFSVGATTWNGSQSDALANGWTINGSPSNYHVAESETTAGQDALGNAIENPRPNERVLNLTTGTGYATVADSASLDLGTSSLVTHEFWIKIEDGSVNHRIIDKFSSVNGIGLQYISSISSIRVTIKTQSNSTSTWDGATDIADGQWHHIIVRLNNRQTTPVAGDVSILIDGADDSATLFNSASNLTATLTNAEPLNIGFNDDFPTQKLVGQIGDVRQYNRALTADEVLKNYNARKGAYGL